MGCASSTSSARAAAKDNEAPEQRQPDPWTLERRRRKLASNGRNSLSFVLEEGEEDGTHDRKVIFVDVVLLGHDAMDIVQRVCEVSKHRSTSGCGTPSTRSPCSMDADSEEVGAFSTNGDSEGREATSSNGTCPSPDRSEDIAATGSLCTLNSSRRRLQQRSSFYYVGEITAKVRFWPVPSLDEALPQFAPAQKDFVAYAVIFPTDFFDEVSCECLRACVDEIREAAENEGRSPPLVVGLPVSDGYGELNRDDLQYQEESAKCCQEWLDGLQVKDITKGYPAGLDDGETLSDIFGDTLARKILTRNAEWVIKV
mmetsp:Transcript_62262/g.148595  ORF Transcript_62262/g.148595 Transcript_62262/m.148595 type:complete len:313 (-) Transcript_62262:174-1112(-)